MPFSPLYSESEAILSKKFSVRLTGLDCSYGNIFIAVSVKASDVNTSRFLRKDTLGEISETSFRFWFRCAGFLGVLRGVFSYFNCCDLKVITTTITFRCREESKSTWINGKL